MLEFLMDLFVLGCIKKKKLPNHSSPGVKHNSVTDKNLYHNQVTDNSKPHHRHSEAGPAGAGVETDDIFGDSPKVGRVVKAVITHGGCPEDYNSPRTTRNIQFRFSPPPPYYYRH